MKTAPIVLFTYNRPEHLRRTVEALKKNYLARQSELIIFSDGPKEGEDPHAVDEVRHCISTIRGFRCIGGKTQSRNVGLARSVIMGMTAIFKAYDRAIVLEDDLITAPDFLFFINMCLDAYKHDSRIFSVSGYTPNIDFSGYDKDIYLAPRTCSWGWGTWRDRWNKVDWEVKDFDSFIRSKQLRREFNCGGEDSSVMLLRQMRGKIDSWAVRFYYSCFKNGGLCVYPTRSRVKNNGADGSGTHFTRMTSKYDIPYELQKSPFSLPVSIHTDKDILKRFAAFYRPSIQRRGINQFKLLLNRLKLL